MNLQFFWFLCCYNKEEMLFVAPCTPSKSLLGLLNLCIDVFLHFWKILSHHMSKYFLCFIVSVFFFWVFLQLYSLCISFFISRGNTTWNSSQSLFWLYIFILPRNVLWYLLSVLNYTISNLLFISLCKLLNFHLTLWFWNVFICIDMVTLFGSPSMKVP